MITVRVTINQIKQFSSFWNIRCFILVFLDFGIIRWHVLYFRWFKPKVNTRWFCILKSVSESNRASISILKPTLSIGVTWGHFTLSHFFWLMKTCEIIPTCAMIKSVLDYSMDDYERNIFNGIIFFDECSLLMILRHNFFRS